MVKLGIWSLSSPGRSLKKYEPCSSAYVSATTIWLLYCMMFGFWLGLIGLDLVYPHFPLCFEAFEHYQRNAVTFSEQEMYVIKELLHNVDTKTAIKQCEADYESFNLGKRETDEFLEKIRSTNELTD